MQLNDSNNITYQNLWDTLKAVLRGKFILLNTHIRKTEPRANKQCNDEPQTPRKRGVG